MTAGRFELALSAGKLQALMVRLLLAKQHEVEEMAAGFRPEYMSHAKRLKGSTPWEASTSAAFTTVHAAAVVGEPERASRRRARFPRVDGYLLQLVVEALAGQDAAQACEEALQGRLDVHTGEDKTTFSCPEFMRALHDAGGVSIWRLWRGLELIVGVVSLYKLALDEVGAVDGRRFRAATDSLLESERLSDEERSEIDPAIETVWERHDVFLSAGLGAQVKLPEMLRVAIDTVVLGGEAAATSSSHTWETDAEVNECEDCGQETNTWCKHCEACKNCDDIGNGHICSVAAAYQRVLRLAAASWCVRSARSRQVVVQYDSDGGTGLQLYQAVLKSTGQNCLIVDEIQDDSQSAKKGVREGMMLCSCQGECTIGLQQHEMLYLPLDERPLQLAFVDWSVHALTGDSRHGALLHIAKRRAEAQAKAERDKRDAWNRRGKVVVSTAGSVAADSLAYKALSDPKFDSRREPFNRPICREITRKWGANFVAERQLHESMSKSDPVYLETSAKVRVPTGKPTVGFARQLFSATRMVNAAEHIERLDLEYSQYLSSHSKKGKSAPDSLGDYVDEAAGGVHERSHDVYLPRSLHDSMTQMPAEMEAVLTHTSNQRRTLKSMVSKKLRRYTSYGFDLNLTYIMPNIIAMGFPAEGREATYRNQMTEVQRFLNTRHPNEYRVYNLCSERNYSPMRFRHLRAPEGSVCCYPFDDHSPPTLHLMKECCEDMHQWLQNDEADPEPDGSHVCVVHCKAGKGRTGTIIAAYLLLAGEFDKATEALEYFAHCRTLNAKGVTIPSQIRYVHYFERWLRSPHFDELPTPSITLNKIRLITVPDFAGDGSCNPYFVVAKGYQDETGAEMLYDLKERLASTARGGAQKVERVVASEPYIDFDTELVLSGDVCIQFLHSEARGASKQMCHVCFHTAFIHSDKVVIPKHHVDKACKDKGCKHFRPNFSIEFHFDVHRNAPEPLAHDHSDGYTVYEKVDEDAVASHSWNAADSATLLSRRTLHAKRGEPLPSPRLVGRSDGTYGGLIATPEAHQAVSKMKRRPGTPIDAVRRSLEFYALDTNSRVPTPLVIEAELALYVAEAFGGDETSSLVRGRMMQANLTGCRFGWMGRRDRLYCHEVLPIIEQVLDEKTELLWSQAQAAASIGEAQLASALQLVVGVASFFAKASIDTEAQGARLDEDGFRNHKDWGGDAPSRQDLADAWQAVKAASPDGGSWVGVGDVLRTAVTGTSIFGQSELRSFKFSRYIGNHDFTASKLMSERRKEPKFSLLLVATWQIGLSERHCDTLARRRSKLRTLQQRRRYAAEEE